MLKIKILFFFFFVFFYSISQPPPTTIPNLVVWYDSDSLEIDANNRVSIWYDKSENNFDAAQSSSSKMPILNTGLNNLPTVSFNGGQSLVSIFEQDFGSNNTYFIVCNDLSTGSNRYFYSYVEGHSGYSLFHRSNEVMALQIDEDYPQSYEKSYPFDYTLFTVQYAQTSYNIRENGIFRDQGNVSSSGSLSSIKLGSAFNNTSHIISDISEVIVYNRILDSLEIAKVERYLMNKYAPPVSLGDDINNFNECDIILRPSKWYSSYKWSDGSIADTLAVSKPGIYWVETKDVFGYTSIDTVTVWPEFLSFPQLSICENESIEWQLPSEGGYDFLWSDGSTGDKIEISSAGIYYAEVTTPNGCTFTTDTLHFTEDHFSSQSSLGEDVSLCSGNFISLNTPDTNDISYLWSTGATTPSLEINTSGEYSVIATNSNGCVAKDTIQVTIIGDAPLVALDLPTEVCLNEVFSFNDASSTTDGSDIISWSWNLGEATQSTEEGGEHVYHQAQDYMVELTIETSSGCSQTGEAQITVHSLPALDINTTNYCAEREVQFFGGQTTPTLISSWDWEMGDGNLLSGEEITHVYASAGDYEVVLVGTDIYGCKDTVEFLKTIYPLPEVSFAFEEICEGEVVQFHNTSQVPGQGNISAYQWDFGDGTSSSYTTPQKPYTSYGEYEVVLTATSEAGCSADSTQTLKVHAFPTVNHQLAQNCAGISALLEDQSYVPNGSIAVVDWSINGQPVGSGFQFTHVFPQEGTYTLKQDVHSAFGCRSVKEYTISIEDYLAAGFTIDPEAFVTDFPIAFENTSEGASQYTWHFGDFATSNTADTNFIFTEDQVGDSVQVTLVVDNEHGCTDSTSLTLPVLARGTDLALTQLFVQENGGFMQIGVELQNLGTTPIENVALTLHKTGLGTLKEIWEGQLLAGEKEIYVFTASPTANVSLKDSLHDALCVSGHILSPVQFKETNFSNNEICRTPSTGTVLLQPAPNPVENVLTLKVVAPKATKGEIIITDHLGRVVARIAEQEYAKGLNKVEIPTWNWSAGVYKIRWEGEEKVVVSVVKK